MAVREFLDENGRLWRAWDIKPESIHPPTRAEDWLADCYVTGWIVFETISGGEKRRLCPWPMKWAEATDRELRELLTLASVVPPQRNAEQREEGAIAPKDAAAEDAVNLEELDITDLEVVRTFRYPGGRFWTVCIMNPEDSDQPVLRFTSGMRTIDLRKWPKNWADHPDDVLVLMLRYAAPRRGSGSSMERTPRRRWDDLQQTVS